MQLELAEPTYSIIGSVDTMLLIINDPEDMPTISFLTDEIHVSEEQKSLIIPIRKTLIIEYVFMANKSK